MATLSLGAPGVGGGSSSGNSERSGTSLRPTSFTLFTSLRVGACVAWARVEWGAAARRGAEAGEAGVSASYVVGTSFTPGARITPISLCRSFSQVRSSRLKAGRPPDRAELGTTSPMPMQRLEQEACIV